MPKAKAKTLNDFKSTFDPDIIVPQKLRAALAAMLKEHPENWEFEIDIVKRANISNGQIARYRAQFDAHVLEVRENGRQARRVWFASAKVAAAARGV